MKKGIINFTTEEINNIKAENDLDNISYLKNNSNSCKESKFEYKSGKNICIKIETNRNNQKKNKLDAREYNKFKTIDDKLKNNILNRNMDFYTNSNSSFKKMRNKGNCENKIAIMMTNNTNKAKSFMTSSVLEKLILDKLKRVT